jgi:molybdate-binding protein/DNA-binding XRE family transcriptional regulator
MCVFNQLAETRTSRGLSAAALARHAGVSRQTIYAIEAGSYVPNTAVALRLADTLEVSVEDLFRLEGEAEPKASTCQAELLNAGGALRAGQPLQLARIGRKMIGVYSPPLSFGLPPADGFVVRPQGKAKASVQLLGEAGQLEKRLVIGGCDPGISVLARQLERAGFDVVTASCSSLQALRWLKEKKIHVAGAHLGDAAAGVTNLGAIRKVFPTGGCSVVGFAGWEEGLLTAASNPKRIGSMADLARKDVTLINREQGAGSRFLLDRSLKALGVRSSRVRGYGDIAHGHIPAAWHVYSGKADCCVATRAAARVFGLKFLPLVSEQFDLVVPKRHLKLPAVQAMLDTLNRSALQRQLRELGGYDTSQTGKVVA